MAHAIDSLKNNRRYLQEKSNRFQKKKTFKSTNKTKSTKKVAALNSWTLKLADKKRQHKMRIQIVIIAIVSIMGTMVLLQKGNALLSKQLIPYNKDMKHIEKNALARSHKEAYDFLVKRGRNNLRVNNWQAAQSEFTRALTLFPTGQKANIGLTKCLISQCEYEKKYCKEATDYLNKLKELGINFKSP